MLMDVVGIVDTRVWVIRLPVLLSAYVMDSGRRECLPEEDVVSVMVEY